MEGMARNAAEAMGLVPVVHQYANLAYDSFTVIGPAAVRATNDPETGECYLVMDIRVKWIG
jgi:hypothetical protein